MGGGEKYKVNIAGESESVLDRRWTVLSAGTRSHHVKTITNLDLTQRSRTNQHWQNVLQLYNIIIIRPLDVTTDKVIATLTVTQISTLQSSPFQSVFRLISEKFNQVFNDI